MVIMDRDISHSHRCVELQLMEVARAMIEPLKSGLRSFNNVSEILLSVKADLILPGCQTFSDIRGQIENMKQQMEKSEQVARKELQRIDKETECLTAEQSHLANQKKQRESELEDLKKHLESHRSSLQKYTEALETARRSLRSAEDTLKSMTARRDQAQVVRDAGIVVSLIPVVGWITGPPLIAAGQVDLNQASHAINEAKKEVENCESQVKSYSDNVSKYNNLICQTQRHIQEADKKIKETAAKLQGVSVKRRVVADLQAKMRQAVRHLGLLCGVGSVAELQTKLLILLKPVMNVMEEMTTALGHITGDQLLNTEGIKSLMGEMKKNQNKLKQLADTNKQ